MVSDWLIALIWYVTYMAGVWTGMYLCRWAFRHDIDDDE